VRATPPGERAQANFINMLIGIATIAVTTATHPGGGSGRRPSLTTRADP
jgi:hypothetical protein